MTEIKKPIGGVSVIKCWRCKRKFNPHGISYGTGDNATCWNCSDEIKNEARSEEKTND